MRSHLGAELLYSVVVQFTSELAKQRLSNHMESMIAAAQYAFAWAHDDDVAMPSTVPADLRGPLQMHAEFRRLVVGSGPLPPVHNFRPLVQHTYDITKSGVDSGQKHMNTIRIPRCPWEPSFVLRVGAILTWNSVQIMRLCAYPPPLDAQFRSFAHYRDVGCSISAF